MKYFADIVKKEMLVTHVRCEDLEPARRTIVLARILEAERHPILVHLPSGNGAPLKFHHLRLQSTILLCGVQLESGRSYRRYHVAFLP